MLEHEGPAHGRALADADPARIRAQQPVDQAQRHALARPVRTDDRGDAGGRDRRVEAVDDRFRAGPVDEAVEAERQGGADRGTHPKARAA